MREALGDKLPTFSYEEKKLLKGSVDYYGLNFYSAAFVSSLNSSTAATSDDQLEIDGMFHISCEQVQIFSS